MAGEPTIHVEGQGEPRIVFTVPEQVVSVVRINEGPEGRTGPPLNIMGELESASLLPNAANSSTGDAFVINGNLWVFSGDSQTWVNIGKFEGPKGDRGDRGFSLEYEWNGTKLRVKREDQAQFDEVDLVGHPGVVISTTEPPQDTILWVDPSGGPNETHHLTWAMSEAWQLVSGVYRQWNVLPAPAAWDEDPILRWGKVRWPEYTEGIILATHLDREWNAVDGYIITDESAKRKIIQPPVTRDKFGQVTKAPPLEVEPMEMELIFRVEQGGDGLVWLPFRFWVNATVDWGDGSPPQTYVSASTLYPTHTYAAPGDYLVKISGVGMNGWGFGGSNNWAPQLYAVLSWGSLESYGTDWHQTFRGAYNLAAVPPKLPAGVANLRAAFFNCQRFNMDISGWDTSSVVGSFHQIFRTCMAFDQPLNPWKVGGITNMEAAFRDARKFNQDLDQWDVSNVLTMMEMFRDAHAFNGKIGTWDVSKVTNMQSMFLAALEFNQDLNGWNVGNVVNMQSMFNNAQKFNGSLAGWNTSKVTNMLGMFFNALKFNKPVGHFDTSKVTTMAAMFQGSTGVMDFDQDVSNWNVTELTNATSMFVNSSFSQVNYDKLLLSWANQNVKNNVPFHAGTAKYGTNGSGNPLTDPAAARAKLVTQHGWVISDGGPA